jgi:dipeptidase
VTYPVVGNINEMQVAIGETTFGGRKELKGPAGIDRLRLAHVDRPRAGEDGARGHRGDDEARRRVRLRLDRRVLLHRRSERSLDHGDDRQGGGREGRRLGRRAAPDGTISAHANQPRIRQFPLNDPKNVLYSPDVITFAREKGWFDGKDEEFSFADVYAPLAARAPALLRRAGLERLPPRGPVAEPLLDEVHRRPRREPLPLWIKPDKKLSVRTSWR